MNCSQMAVVLGRSYSATSTKIFKLGYRLNQEDRNRLTKAGLRDTARAPGSLNGNWKGGISSQNYAYKKRQKERHPEKHKARVAVSTAIKRGKLQRGVCVKCGIANADAHHADYSRPLDVVWLCRKCHRAEHKRNGTKNQ